MAREPSLKRPSPSKLPSPTSSILSPPRSAPTQPETFLASSSGTPASYASGVARSAAAATTADKEKTQSGLLSEAENPPLPEIQTTLQTAYQAARASVTADKQAASGPVEVGQSATVQLRGSGRQPSNFAAAESAAAAQNRTWQGRAVETPDLGQSSSSSGDPQNMHQSVGPVSAVAWDKQTCRRLRQKFKEGGPAAIDYVLPELLRLENLAGALMNINASLLIQSILVHGSSRQRVEILIKVYEEEAVIRLACDQHGTKIVQKLIETLSHPLQVQLMTRSLKTDMGRLIRDQWGHKVILCCLRCLNSADSQFVYDAVAADAISRSGKATGSYEYLVFKNCLKFASSQRKLDLATLIAENVEALDLECHWSVASLKLIVELEHGATNTTIIKKLAGRFVHLSKQSQSTSRLVQALLRFSEPKSGELQSPEQNLMVEELINSRTFPELLEDSNAYFVIRRALTATSGDLHQTLVEAIDPHLSSMEADDKKRRIIEAMKDDLDMYKTVVVTFVPVD